MRLHFVVHTFINMYLTTPSEESTDNEVFGFKINQLNGATKQSHLLTLDKAVCSMPAQKSIQTMFFKANHFMSEDQERPTDSD